MPPILTCCRNQGWKVDLDRIFKCQLRVIRSSRWRTSRITCLCSCISNYYYQTQHSLDIVKYFAFIQYLRGIKLEED